MKVEYYNLMVTSEKDIPKCIGEHGHVWENIKFPAHSQSGWHEDECKICHIKIGYDTSD